MTRGRRAYLVGSLLLLAASLHAPTAYSAVGDPPTGSPAGAVYELPLERGRSDGAPTLGGGGSGGDGTLGGGQPGEATSLYRSENNFGSSSRVPGIAAAGAAGVAAAGAGAGGVADSSPGVAGESGGDDGGSAGAAGALARGEIADAGNTSTAAAAVLLGAIALLAAAIGYLSRRING